MEIDYTSNIIGFILLIILIGLIIWSLIITLNPKLSEERVKTISGYFKFLTGSIVLVLITFFVNKGLEERELAIQESKQLNEQVKYLIGQDVGVKKEYVEYFSIVTRSYQARDRWKKYFNQVKGEYEIKINEKITNGDKISKNDSLAYNKYSKIIFEQSLVLDSLNENVKTGSKINKDLAAKIKQSERKLTNAKATFDSLQFENFYLKQEQKKIETKLESASDKRLNLTEINLRESEICDDLFQPLLTYLETSKDIYTEKYKKNGYRYEDAKKLYDLNINMVNLISEKSGLIPNYLVKDVKNLVNHFNAWIKGFENTLIKIPSPSNKTRFQVIYYGETFPSASAKLIESDFNERCK